MRMRQTLMAMLVVGVVLALAVGPVTGEGAGPQSFDAGMYGDLAVGVPRENVGSLTDAGAVTVMHGAEAGLTPEGCQYWTQNMGLVGTAERFDYFGRALAAGDMNGDGYGDLAVGVPEESVGSVDEGGAVNVIYGTPAEGLAPAHNQYWNQNEDGMSGTAEPEDHFGAALAIGDFNGDGIDDLAVGVPDEDVAGVDDAGAVHVLYGSAGGLTADGDLLWTQNDTALEAGDQVGAALAAGYFDDDDYEDLAIGIPSEDLGSTTDAGVVEILYGSSSGLISRPSNDFWHQDRSTMESAAEEHDLFGTSLATGDFDGDGLDDLAVGVPFEDLDDDDAGGVHILYGTPDGLTAAGNRFWHQDSPQVGGKTEEGDRFGEALAAGDFDGDGRDDLAVGVPREDWEVGDTDSGIVHVLYGSPSGISARDQVWHQDSPDVAGALEAGDQFGYAVAAGNLNGDGYDDLVVGVPFEDLGDPVQADAGAVQFLLGAAGGLAAEGNDLYAQGDGACEGAPEAGDRFGAALVVYDEAPGIRVFLPLILRNSAEDGG